MPLVFRPALSPHQPPALPPLPDICVQRDADVASLAGYLLSRRLVLLCGVAEASGIGKAVVALQLAHWAHHRRFRVVYVRRGEEPWNVVLRETGKAPSVRQTDEDRIHAMTAALAALASPVLLVVDSARADAGVQRAVEALLDAAPLVRVCVVIRGPLQWDLTSKYKAVQHVVPYRISYSSIGRIS